MEKAYSEKEKAERMKSDSDSDSEQDYNKPSVSVSVSEPSSSIIFHSPSLSPIPSLRTDKDKPPSSPSLHSLSDDSSSISDDHFTVNDDPPPVVVAHRFQVEPNVVTKVDPVAQDGFVDTGVKDDRQAAAGSNRLLRPDVTVVLRSRKVAMLNKALFGLRITSFVFCLLSLSVLAADKQQGWALDSFYVYKEFRFSLSVNVIGFVYSAFQICDLVTYLITRKHLLDHWLRSYFSFALDQVLTYLLMSASSSAATRAYDWESNWGEDRFPYMANASVALSFVAFVAFALASLVSGSILCKFR